MNGFNLMAYGLAQQQKGLDATACRCDAYKFPHRIGGGQCTRSKHTWDRPPLTHGDEDKSPKINGSAAWHDSGHSAGDFS